MKLLSCEKAEAELVGHIIILGITILGVSMIALYGVPAIYSLEDMANVRNVEQSFAVLDSRASRAILGDSPLQITSINLGGGSLTVEPNSSGSPSYIVVRDKNNTFSVTIPMGKIKYTLGDRIVAYEGGGVWSKYPSGSLMLSRPEFNFNGVTLTLPVFNISGKASVGGRGTAAVSFKKPAVQVLYPNTNTSNSGGVNRTNPVNFSIVEKVYVNITSDFYDAWADHIETAVKSAKVVSVDKNTKTTSIELTVYPGYIGKSDSEIKNPIEFRGLDPSDATPLNNFSFRIYSQDKDGDWDDIKWDIRAKSGTKSLIFSIYKKKLTIGYKDTQYGYSKPAETWGEYTYTPDPTGAYIDVDLLNTSLNLRYKDYTPVGDNAGSGNGIGCSIDKINDFNNTGPGFSWGIPSPLIEDVTQKSLYNITQHYMQLMAQEGDISFGQCSTGDHDPDSDSTMYIDYVAPGGLTYLHITDNKADVGIS